MSAETLKEFNRGLDIAESVIAQYGHGSQGTMIMMKLAEARAIADELLGNTIAVTAGAMASRMS